MIQCFSRCISVCKCWMIFQSLCRFIAFPAITFESFTHSIRFSICIFFVRVYQFQCGCSTKRKKRIRNIVNGNWPQSEELTVNHWCENNCSFNLQIFNSRNVCQSPTYRPSFLWPFFEWYLMPFTFLYRFLQPGTGHANGFSFDALLPVVPECL